MRLLAIDTALAACAAAVFDSDLGSMLAQESRAMQRGHAEALIPLIGRVMDRAGLSFSELDRVAVTLGPGSFTGLRVGIAAARGIALAANKPAVGVSTLSAYAAPHIASFNGQPVVSAIDARHEHVYVQIVGADGRALVAPRFAPLHEAAQRAAASGSPLVAGNAAQLLTAAWPAEEPAPSAIDQRESPDIASIAVLGAAAEETGADLKPLYLRAPDARAADALPLRHRC